MSSVAIGVKYSDDNEFDCIRRIMSKLGLSSPESDEDILCLSKYRSIERCINANFVDLNKLHKLTEENKRLRDALLKALLVVNRAAGMADSEAKIISKEVQKLLSELDGE